MRTLSIFSRVPGALALGTSICSLSLMAMAGTANANVVHVTVAYSAPQTGLVTVPPEPTGVVNSCYVQFDDPASTTDHVIDCALVDPSNSAVPPVWKDSELGDLVLLETGTTTLPTGPDGCLSPTTGITATCSDVVRFVNLVPPGGGPPQAHIIIASDAVSPADLGAGAIPAKQGTKDQFAVEVADAGAILTARQLQLASGAIPNPVRVRMSSKKPPTFSDIILVWY